MVNLHTNCTDRRGGTLRLTTFGPATLNHYGIADTLLQQADVRCGELIVAKCRRLLCAAYTTWPGLVRRAESL